MFVVVGGKEDVVYHALQHGVELLRILFHRLSVQNLAVVFACIKIFIFVLGKGDLLFVVSELEICDIVRLLQRRIVHASVFLLVFTLLFICFYLLGSLLWLPCEIPGAYLST